MRHIFQILFTGINSTNAYSLNLHNWLHGIHHSQYLKWFINASKIPSIFALKKLHTSINFHGSIALHNTTWCMDQHFVGQWTFRAWFSLFLGRKALIAHDTLTPFNVINRCWKLFLQLKEVLFLASGGQGEWSWDRREEGWHHLCWSWQVRHDFRYGW